ncbi:hypothetical protein NEHOM01_0689 [Nematocida homosporus]|uniref:uncharacterized protein n=1 Tax=Nematocida homosporus TaxID=1912981 RepID=UPI00221E98F9|nr:uncharacterized protein NEHOM01_0689 [Nematocida homosporus]KAI5185231.1 hypothetical protein NEHOM01_0689 [Nematocida homosporus]
MISSLLSWFDTQKQVDTELIAQKNAQKSALNQICDQSLDSLFQTGIAAWSKYLNELFYYRAQSNPPRADAKDDSHIYTDSFYSAINTIALLDSLLEAKNIITQMPDKHLTLDDLQYMAQQYAESYIFFSIIWTDELISCINLQEKQMSFVQDYSLIANCIKTMSPEIQKWLTTPTPVCPTTKNTHLYPACYAAASIRTKLSKPTDKNAQYLNKLLLHPRMRSIIVRFLYGIQTNPLAGPKCAAHQEMLLTRFPYNQIPLISTANPTQGTDMSDSDEIVYSTVLHGQLYPDNEAENNNAAQSVVDHQRDPSQEQAIPDIKVTKPEEPTQDSSKSEEASPANPEKEKPKKKEKRGLFGKLFSRHGNDKKEKPGTEPKSRPATPQPEPSRYADAAISSSYSSHDTPGSLNPDSRCATPNHDTMNKSTTDDTDASGIPTKRRAYEDNTANDAGHSQASLAKPVASPRHDAPIAREQVYAFPAHYDPRLLSYDAETLYQAPAMPKIQRRAMTPDSLERFSSRPATPGSDTTVIERPIRRSFSPARSSGQTTQPIPLPRNPEALPKGLLAQEIALEDAGFDPWSPQILGEHPEFDSVPVVKETDSQYFRTPTTNPIAQTPEPVRSMASPPTDCFDHLDDDRFSDRPGKYYPHEELNSHQPFEDDLFVDSNFNADFYQISGQPSQRYASPSAV